MNHMKGMIGALAQFMRAYQVSSRKMGLAWTTRKARCCDTLKPRIFTYRITIEYEQIRRLITEGRINVLIVYSSDRHTRDPIHGQIFRRELRNADCELHYVTEGKVDIYTAQGELINTVKDAFAKYWAQMILQTTKEKRDAYIEDGFPVIGMAPYGFKRVGKKRQARFEKIDDLCQLVMYMYERMDKGWGVTELRENLRGKPTPGDIFMQNANKPTWGRKKREYGVWNNDAIYNILRDEVYAGVFYANRWQMVNGKKVRAPREQWLPIAVPAVVDRDLWERVQRRLDEGARMKQTGTGKYDYLLARRIKCRWCGYYITGVTRPTQQYYACGAQNTGKSTKLRVCEKPYAYVSTIDDVVWKFVIEALEDPRTLRRVLRQAQDELAKEHGHIYDQLKVINDLVDEKTAEIKALVTTLRLSKNPRLIAAIEEQADTLSAEIDGLEAEKLKLEERIREDLITDADIAALEDYAISVRPRLANADFALKREVIERMNLWFEIDYHNEEHVVYIIWHVYEFKRETGVGRKKKGWPGNKKQRHRQARADSTYNDNESGETMLSSLEPSFAGSTCM
jgi:site-specific DNA recombinase